MNIDSNILELIVSKMDNDSIRSLSLIPDIWNQMLSFISHSNFWFLRTQVLVSRDLSFEEGNWKEAYYILSQMQAGEYRFSGSIYSPFSLVIGTRINSYMFCNEEDNTLVMNVLLALDLDPSAKDNRAIIQCCENECVNLTRALLKDKRVNPAACGNYSLLIACINQYLEIISLLLQDPRVDPYAENYEAIIQASRRGNTEVVALLLEDDASRGCKMESSILDRVLLEASENGHTEVVRLLLQDKRILLTATYWHVIRRACQEKHIDILRLLVTDSRIIPSELEDEGVIKYLLGWN